MKTLNYHIRISTGDRIYKSQKPRIMNIPVMTAEREAHLPLLRVEVPYVALIDADFLKYFVTKDVYDWLQKNKDKNLMDVFGLNYLEHFVNERIKNSFEDVFHTKALVFLFSDSNENTYRVACSFEKKYKGNRKLSEDYMYENKFEDMASVIHIINQKYTTFIKKGFEADDLAGIFQNDKTFIYSFDKDLKQIPGKHWNMDLRKIEEHSSTKCLNFFCYQLLAGDSVDNIPGFPGMGEVKSTEFLNRIGNVKHMPFEIMKHYAKTFGIFDGIDMFVEQWMMLKLRSHRGAYLQDQFKTEIETIKSLCNYE